LSKTPTLALLLVAIGFGSLVVGLAYTAYDVRSNTGRAMHGQYQQGIMGGGYQQLHNQSASSISIDQAKTIAQQYLDSTRNPNLAIKEIMEFQYNFYILYYEKDTGIRSFEMLIWKQVPSSGTRGGGVGMGSQMRLGIIVPEPGPNMMWNTKYSDMGRGLIINPNHPTTTMSITKDLALQTAQTYLDTSLNGAKAESATQFYGYYTIDYMVNGKIAGMLSVNGLTGQVWYHSWHGQFVQEIEFG
jgi:hypothetical protein